MRDRDFNVIADTQGMVYVTGTGNNAGPYSGIKALTATVIASMTCPLITGASLAAISLSAGDFLPFPGGATNVTLTSGTAMLVNV